MSFITFNSFGPLPELVSSLKSVAVTGAGASGMLMIHVVAKKALAGLNHQTPKIRQIEAYGISATFVGGASIILGLSWMQVLVIIAIGSVGIAINDLQTKINSPKNESSVPLQKPPVSFKTTSTTSPQLTKSLVPTPVTPFIPIVVVDNPLTLEKIVDVPQPLDLEQKGIIESKSLSAHIEIDQIFNVLSIPEILWLKTQMKQSVKQAIEPFLNGETTLSDGTTSSLILHMHKKFDSFIASVQDEKDMLNILLEIRVKQENHKQKLDNLKKLQKAKADTKAIKEDLRKAQEDQSKYTCRNILGHIQLNRSTFETEKKQKLQEKEPALSAIVKRIDIELKNLENLEAKVKTSYGKIRENFDSIVLDMYLSQVSHELFEKALKGNKKITEVSEKEWIAQIQPIIAKRLPIDFSGYSLGSLEEYQNQTYQFIQTLIKDEIQKAEENICSHVMSFLYVYLRGLINPEEATKRIPLMNDLLVKIPHSTCVLDAEAIEFLALCTYLAQAGKIYDDQMKFDTSIILTDEERKSKSSGKILHVNKQAKKLRKKKMKHYVKICAETLKSNLLHDFPNKMSIDDKKLEWFATLAIHLGSFKYVEFYPMVASFQIADLNKILDNPDFHQLSPEDSNDFFKAHIRNFLGKFLPISSPYFEISFNKIVKAAEIKQEKEIESIVGIYVPFVASLIENRFFNGKLTEDREPPVMENIEKRIPFLHYSLPQKETESVALFHYLKMAADLLDKKLEQFKDDGFIIVNELNSTIFKKSFSAKEKVEKFVLLLKEVIPLDFPHLKNLNEKDYLELAHEAFMIES